MRPYPVPKVHEENFKNDMERLVLLWVLEAENDSEWGAPSFAQPKPKSNRVCFISDFMSFNKKIKTRTITYAKNKLNVIEIGGFSVWYVT